MSNQKTEKLLDVSFGKFGNYGSKLSVELKDDGIMPVLTLENWAYGETTAAVSAYGIGSKDLVKLSKDFMEAAIKLEEREKAYK